MKKRRLVSGDILLENDVVRIGMKDYLVSKRETTKVPFYRLIKPTVQLLYLEPKPLYKYVLIELEEG